MQNLLYQFENRKIRKSFNKEYKKLNFDVKKIDLKIEKLAQKIYNSHKKKFKTFEKFNCEYSIFATTFYDQGGHTPCAINLAKSFNKEKFPVYLSKLDETIEKAPKATNKLKKYTQIYGVNFDKKDFVKNLIEMYNLIIDNPSEVVFVFTHPDEILLTAVTTLLKKTTPMKFIFFNHASHYPNLGMNFADLILEGMPTTTKVTNEKRHLYNTKIIGLQSKAKEETIYYPKEELNKIRMNFGIQENELMTISGGASYKFFDKNSSEYFKMIKKILEEKPNLKHIVMTNLNESQKEIIDSIFSNSKEKERLIITPLSSDYEKNFQAADLYIDSFPVSSALTQIDLMYLKTATVVKINKETPQWSFHEYMPQNYPYMYENIDAMLNGIIYLLGNKQEREKIINSNYEFWLKNYESRIVRDKYIDFAKEADKKIKIINFKDINYDLQLETLNWRNSKQVSKYFKIPKIELNTHINWLESLKKENPKNIAFMIFAGKKPIGVTYFHSIDYSKKTGDWGIYIYDTQQRGKGIGDIALKECINYAQNIGLKKIYLDVLYSNKKAKKLYENNGFKIIDNTKEKFVRYLKVLT